MDTQKLRTISVVAIAVISLTASVVGILRYVESKLIADISGEWKITDHIETGPYSGTTLEFRIFLSQDGTTFEGTGEKWSENGKIVPPSLRTTLTIIGGSIEGEEIIATFMELEGDREIPGQFSWRLETDDRLVGSYSTTSSEGSSVGVRVQ